MPFFFLVPVGEFSCFCRIEVVEMAVDWRRRMIESYFFLYFLNKKEWMLSKLRVLKWRHDLRAKEG
jgi:hypothetical protein